MKLTGENVEHVERSAIAVPRDRTGKEMLVEIDAEPRFQNIRVRQIGLVPGLGKPDAQPAGDKGVDEPRILVRFEKRGAQRHFVHRLRER